VPKPFPTVDYEKVGSWIRLQYLSCFGSRLNALSRGVMQKALTGGYQYRGIWSGNDLILCCGSVFGVQAIADLTITLVPLGLCAFFIFFGFGPRGRGGGCMASYV